MGGRGKGSRSSCFIPEARQVSSRGLKGPALGERVALRGSPAASSGHVAAETESENDDGIAETTRKIDRGVTDIAQRFGCQAPQVVGIFSPECVLGESRDENVGTAIV